MDSKVLCLRIALNASRFCGIIFSVFLEFMWICESRSVVCDFVVCVVDFVDAIIFSAIVVCFQ